jgi:hypothetical protein
MNKQELAQNPQTLPERLRELSLDEDPTILAAIAENPSTPLETLLALTQRFPQEFLRNPVLPWLLLEHPYFLCEAPKETIRVLLALPHCPPWVFMGAAVHPDQWMRNDILNHPKMPLSLLSVFSQDPDSHVRYTVAKHPLLTPAIIETLAYDQNSSVRARIAIHPRTPPELLEELSNDREHPVRLEIARNAKISRTTLYRLALDKNREVRLMVAENLKASPPTLERLSEDKDVRAAAARHPMMPHEELGFLAEDPSTKVREGVATNTKTKALLLKTLERRRRAGTRRRSQQPQHSTRGSPRALA